MTLMEDEIDLRHYRPAGGPVIVTILELPAPPKTIGQWTIRKGDLLIIGMYVSVLQLCVCVWVGGCGVFCVTSRVIVNTHTCTCTCMHTHTHTHTHTHMHTHTHTHSRA